MPRYEENYAEYEKLWKDFESIKKENGIFSFRGKVINKVPANFSERIQIVKDNAVLGLIQDKDKITPMENTLLLDGIRVLKEIIAQAEEAAGLAVKRKSSVVGGMIAAARDTARRMGTSKTEMTTQQKLAASKNTDGTIDPVKARKLGLDIQRPPEKRPESPVSSVSSSDEDKKILTPILPPRPKGYTGNRKS